ncbi:MAG: transporter substrate-binding domain-containing protein [Synergistaceae bacterium]|nr:transporter substrate-binding domain-containing protein [Synergistaceae bacterium]MDD4838570.1 transporter substrate-binding domain-containing protein [Synergistaceae bacterium]
MRSGSRVILLLIAFVIIVFYPVFFCLTQQADSSSQYTVPLTVEEKEYIQKLGPVKMCVDPDWEPYEKINDKGKHEGISADLIKLITERTGITIELLPTNNWKESIEASKAGKCHILSFLNQTPEREKWLIFTKPYFTDPNVLITRNEHAYISDFKQFTDESMVLPEGTSIEEKVTRDYPDLKIFIVASENEAVEMVTEKKADMTLRSLTMAAYTIRKEGLFNLKIAGEIPDYKNYLRIGVSKDHKILRDILDKGIDTITPMEVQAVINKYVSIDASTRIDYVLVARIVASFILLLILGLIWNSQLTKLNRKLAKREKELTNLSRQLEVDVEARKKSEKMLRISEEKYRLLFENAVEAIIVIQDGYIKICNPMTEILTGYSSEEIKSIPFTGFIHPDQRQLLVKKNIKRLMGEPTDNIYDFMMLKKDGTLRWIEINSIRIDWQGSPATLHFLIDITARKETEERNYYLMYHDQLTGLYNRSYINLIMKEIRDFMNIGLFMFDIDGLKYVNDTYGHLQGDKLILESAEIIKNAFGNGEITARIGGDEFIVIIRDCTGEKAEGALVRVKDQIRKYNDSKSEYFEISISAGYVISEDKDSNFDYLMQKADELMYADKSLKKKNRK